MKRLQTNRIEQLSKYLQTCKLDPELFPEILDHLACEAEEQLWDGNSFEKAFDGIKEAADSQTLKNLGVDHKNLLAAEKSLNDIVFEGRNKLYGAYDLRKGYGQTIQRSVLLGVTIFLLMIMLPNLYATLVPKLKDLDIAYEVKFEDVNIMPEAKPAPALVKNTWHQPKSKSENNWFKILPDSKVDLEFTSPAVDEPEPAKPGLPAYNGNEMSSVAAKRGRLKASSIEMLPEKEETYLFVDQNPQFFGGSAGMSEFIQNNLTYPDQAIKANVEGQVFIEFTVGPSGKIDHVKVIKGIGFGCDEEAVRVVKLMPDWMPGKQGGVPVRVRFTLPITFQMN